MNARMLPYRIRLFRERYSDFATGVWNAGCIVALFWLIVLVIGWLA